jgi:hypothetical protein
MNAGLRPLISAELKENFQLCGNQRAKRCVH